MAQALCVQRRRLQDQPHTTYEYQKVGPAVVEQAWLTAVMTKASDASPDLIVLPAQWTLRVDSVVIGKRPGWQVFEVRRGSGSRAFRYYYHGALVCAAREMTTVTVWWPGTLPARVRGMLQDLSRCARGLGPV